jgi:D-arabinonate dehydratase/D-galactarolactone cycloisomerase
MKITKVEAFAIQARNPSKQEYWGKRSWVTVRDADASSQVVPKGLEYPLKWRMKASYSDTIDTCIVKVTTDEGLVGWGEAKAPVAPQVAQTIVEQLLAPIVLGQDPWDIQVLWEKMYSTMRLRGHLSGFFLEAISGIDIALWDLMGKASGKPIHKLLGGAFRTEIEVYGSGIPGLREGADQAAVEDVIRDTQQMIDRGFKAVKIAGGHGVEADLKTIAVVRDVIGPNRTIFLDTAGNYDLSKAMRLGQAIAHLNVGFLEAPVPPEFVEVHGQLARALDVPIASDLITSRYQAQSYFRHDGLDLVQPDVCRAGGISECKKIADLADVYGAAFAPHLSIGSAIHFAASAQLAAAVPNFMIMEYWIGENPLGSVILNKPFEASNGVLAVPNGPGLGIEINEEALLKHAVART